MYSPVKRVPGAGIGPFSRGWVLRAGRLRRRIYNYIKLA